MVPPGDSTRYQDLKLVEAMKEIRRIEIPPPAYNAIDESSHFVNQSTEDYSDSEADLCPLNVSVDASIAIEGRGNNIILHEQDAKLSQRSSLAKSTESKNIEKHRAERAGYIADAILSAIKQSGLIDQHAGLKQPIDLHINAAVSIKGDNNMLYIGPQTIDRASDDGIDQTRATHTVHTSDREPKRGTKRKAEHDLSQSPQLKKST